MVALATYSPTDPSLNRAAENAVRNLGGKPGAIVADLLLQTVGLAAILIAVMAAAWGWRLLRAHRLPLWWARVCLLPVCVIVAAMALSVDRKSTRLNSSHSQQSRMPSSA